MRVFPIVLAIFLIVPLTEVWLLVTVGGLIGAGWTVFLVVLTAVIGASLVRSQGINTLARSQDSLARGELPAVELLEGAATTPLAHPHLGFEGTRPSPGLVLGRGTGHRATPPAGRRLPPSR